MSDLSTADQLRWLADVIDAVGDQGIDVHDAEVLGVDGDGDRLTAEVVCSAPRPDVLEDADVDEPTDEITEADREEIAFVENSEDWETADDLENDEELPELEALDWEPVDPDPPELADEPLGPEPAPDDDDREDSLDEDEQDEDIQEDVDPLSPGERAIADALEDAGEEIPSSDVIERVDNYAKGTVQGYLSALKDTPHVEYRTDPDQHQRMLYRAPDVDVDEEPVEEDSDDDEKPDLGQDHDPREEIIDAVTTEGELSAEEIAMVTGISTADTHLSELVEESILADREDPQDGRRTLYSLPDDESDTSESASEADPTTALAEDGDEEIVYTAAGNAGNESIIHTNPECKCLKKAQNVREHARSAFPDGHRECEVCMGPDDGEGDQEETDDNPDRPDWIARDANEIVDDVGALNRTLEEVLDVAENAATAIDARQRFGCELVTTKEVLWELGLREQTPDTKLFEEPELSERIETLREVYVDGEEVAT